MSNTGETDDLLLDVSNGAERFVRATLEWWTETLQDDSRLDGRSAPRRRRDAERAPSRFIDRARECRRDDVHVVRAQYRTDDRWDEEC